VRVQGEEASGYRVYIHLPEDWLRRQNQDTLATTAHSNGLFGLIGAFVTSVIVVFLRNLKHPSAAAVPWRKFSKWALAALIAFVCWVFTNIPQYMSRYPTENPLSTYLGMTAVSFVLGSAAVYGLVFVLLGLAWFFIARIYGPDALPFSGAMPALYYRDALVAGASGFAIVAGLSRLRQWIEHVWPVQHYSFSASVPGALDASPPALQALAAAAIVSFTTIAVLALVAGFASAYFRDAWKQVLLLGVVAFLAAPRWGSSGELVQNIVLGWAALLLFWWLARHGLRFNVLAYFLMLVLTMFANAASELLRQPNFYFRANGALLLAVALALLLWPFLAWRRGAPEAVPGGEPHPAA